MQHIKCVVVGDGNVGKTCLLISFSTNSFKEDYLPTVFDNYKTTITLNDRQIELGLWDTSGQPDYARLRPLSYPNTWIPEITHHCPTIPFVLVGTKLDTRPDDYHKSKDSIYVAYKEGQQLADKIHAVSYVECSAKTQVGIKNVFEEAVKAVIIPGYSKINLKKRICVLL